MTTITGPGLFDRHPAVLALPPATLAALQEIPIEGKRAWARSLIVAALAGGLDMEAIREMLSHERLGADLVARLVHTLQDRGAAS